MYEKKRNLEAKNKRKSLTLVTCLFAMAGFSQVDTDTIKPIKLSVVELQMERYSKSSLKTSQKIESISQKEIEFQNFQNTADLLSNSGTLTVQKSQQGGGSPIIRGFEANRILLLVDGIRMNNLIFRAGHLQNVITVDENMLSKVDVLFGPSSTVFGSDAMGGAINLQTKMPLLFSENNNTSSSGNALTRFSSSNSEKSGYFDFNLSGENWGALTAVSYNDFGDLRMGRRRNGTNDFFGERKYYVETVNNVDNLVLNSNKYLQKFSAYKQYNLMQKIVFQQDYKTHHSLNFQFSTTSDIPRYDRLTEPTTTGLKYARWDYGPQKRLLAAYKFSKDKAILNSDLSLSFSYQDVEESRITRKFNANNTKIQVEKVSIYAINADLKTKIGEGELLYGAELFYDNLNSSATNSNRITGIVSPTDSRYPNGKNNTFRSDVFATYSGTISKKTTYNLGARAGFAILNTTIADNSFFNLPFNSIKQKNFTYSGAAGIVKSNNNGRIAFNLASAYRIPNIDDIAKIFESGVGILIVPNQNLKPEKSVTVDVNIEL
jgi:hemoglobin/transferrin/lactoferrin receptor protein